MNLACFHNKGPSLINTAQQNKPRWSVHKVTRKFESILLDATCGVNLKMKEWKQVLQEWAQDFKLLKFNAKYEQTVYINNLLNFNKAK